VPDGESYPLLDGLTLPLDAAPAMQEAANSLDTVVALAEPGEIPARLIAALELAPECRLALLPVVSGRAGKTRTAAAIVAIPGDAPPANLPALELLVAMAALTLDIRQAMARPALASQLLGIGPLTDPKAPLGVVVDVLKLSREEQELHARAQRFARVRVAEMRLYRALAVREGRENRDLFGVLREEIEQSREQFQRDFLTVPTMIDYLHVELVRTLANDDATMLGPDYPGPLV
jgi:hypothetical protein